MNCTDNCRRACNEGRDCPQAVAVTRAALVGFAEMLAQVVAGVLIGGGVIVLSLILL